MVPKLEIRLCVITFPNWNIPFSAPLGIPMAHILFMRLKSGLYEKGFSTCIYIKALQVKNIRFPQKAFFF